MSISFSAGSLDEDTFQADDATLPATSGASSTSQSTALRLDGKLGWSKFTRSLYEIVNDPANSAAIGFTKDGLSIEMRNAKLLGEQVLPKYYRHQNVSSFVRQLNNYSFKTIPAGNGSSAQVFYHEYFRRGRMDLLHLVLRKGAAAKKALAANTPNSTSKSGKPYGGEDVASGASHLAFPPQFEGTLEERLRQAAEINRKLTLENAQLKEENKRLRASQESPQWISQRQPSSSQTLREVPGQDSQRFFQESFHRQAHRASQQQLSKGPDSTAEGQNDFGVTMSLPLPSFIFDSKLNMGPYPGLEYSFGLPLDTDNSSQTKSLMQPSQRLGNIQNPHASVVHPPNIISSLPTQPARRGRSSSATAHPLD